MRLQPREKNTSYEKAKAYRLMNEATGQYLHLSGSGEVKGTEYAWLGFKYQARALRERAETGGESWPFSVVLA